MSLNWESQRMIKKMEKESGNLMLAWWWYKYLQPRVGTSFSLSVCGSYKINTSAGCETVVETLIRSRTLEVQEDETSKNGMIMYLQSHHSGLLHKIPTSVYGLVLSSALIDVIIVLHVVIRVFSSDHPWKRGRIPHSVNNTGL